jgi:hypothetical protein
MTVQDAFGGTKRAAQYAPSTLIPVVSVVEGTVDVALISFSGLPWLPVLLGMFDLVTFAHRCVTGADRLPRMNKRLRQNNDSNPPMLLWRSRKGAATDPCLRYVLTVYWSTRCCLEREPGCHGRIGGHVVISSVQPRSRS